jgi:proteasome accessory factor C
MGDVRPIASMVPTPALIELFEAVRTRSLATFAYRGESRQVAPVGLRFRFGHWYLVAWDLERTAVRTFRVDRVEGEVSRGEPGSAEVPEHVDVEAALPEEPWQAEGDDLVRMLVRVDALEARRVVDEVGHDKLVARHKDGSVDLALDVSSFAAIRSWVLGLLDHAVITEPANFREDVIAWLRSLTATPPPLPSRVRAPEPADEPGSAAAPRSVPGSETSRRLRRLLAVVGWLAQVGEAPISDVSRRFGMSESELVAELELAACCGTPPYTPDTLMEIVVSEDTVRAFLPSEFARPRPLTPAEGFAVATSARLLLAVPGSEDDALRRALAKLDSALGSREVVGLDVDMPANLALVRSAADEGRVIEIDYLSASQDELTTRTVEPLQVMTIDGHWYLDAYCRRAGDMRRFRIDRIGAVRPVEEPAGAPVGRGRPAEEMFVPGPGAREVHLHLGGSAQWVPESVPVRGVRRDADGNVTDVLLDVSGLAWFERLLLQLGPDARVVSPPDLTDLAAAAAARVLARYEGSEA